MRGVDLTYCVVQSITNASLFDTLSLSLANEVYHKTMNATDDKLNKTDSASAHFHLLSELLQDILYAKDGVDFQTGTLVEMLKGELMY